MEKKKSAIWDCDSSLYDSFELKSFKRQLDYAIASRSLSMPRVVVAPVDEKKAPGAAPSVTAKDTGRGRPGKRISKSIQKVLKAVLFRKKPQQKAAVEDEKAAEAAAAAASLAQVGFVLDDDFNFRDVTWVGIGVGGLETIPEVPEKGFGGDGTPESGWRAVRKTVSERFTGRVGVFR